MPRGRIGVWLGALLVTTACQSPQPVVGAQVMSEVDLESLESFFISTHEGDREVGRWIADSLRRRGKQATTGVGREVPEGTQVLVIYDDSWMWDMTMYLLLLRIEFRDPATNLLLATGSSGRPSLVRAPPKTMVNEVLDGIFRGGVLAFPELVTEDPN